MADAVRRADNSVDKNVFIESFSSGGGGLGSFYILLLEKGKVVSRPVELRTNELLAAEFREPDDTSGPPKGRPAHMVAADGSTYYHLTVEAAERTAQGWNFRVRRAGVPFGGKSFIVTDKEIRVLELAPTRPSMLGVDYQEFPQRKARRQGDLAQIAGVRASAPDSDVGTTAEPPPSEGDPPPPRAQPQTDEEWVDQITGISAVYGDQSPLKPEDQKKKKGMFDIGGATSGSQIMAVGYLMLAILLGAIIVITFVVGTFVLMFSAKNEGIGDLTLPRAIATAALLAVVPPGLFIGCMLIPIPLCSVKAIAGIFAWWFSARMIVAGMLEVMEGKATDILISFYAVLVLLMMGVWIYLVYIA
jgi:hypothetical protein